MGTCGKCGQPVRPRMLFCTNCGVTVPTNALRQSHDGLSPLHPVTPPPPPWNGPAAPPVPVYGASRVQVTRRPFTAGGRWIPVGIGVAAAAVVGTVVTLLISGSDADHSAAAAPTPARAAAPSGNPGPSSVRAEPAPAPVYPSRPEPTETTTTSTTPPEPPSAEAALRAEAATDRPAVESLVDSWVPQLSAKKLGLVADGRTYDYPAIWQNYQDLKSRYPNALLVWSGDFTSFKFGDFWVTLLPTPYPDGESANSWCDGAGIPVDDCYAKLISHSHGYDGATLIRPR